MKDVEQQTGTDETRAAAKEFLAKSDRKTRRGLKAVARRRLKQMAGISARAASVERDVGFCEAYAAYQESVEACGYANAPDALLANLRANTARARRWAVKVVAGPAPRHWLADIINGESIMGRRLTVTERSMAMRQEWDELLALAKREDSFKQDVVYGTAREEASHE